MSEINLDIMINDTLNLETLASYLITEFDIKVSEYSPDDLDYYLENKFIEKDLKTLEEYANMCDGEHKLFMYYLYAGNDMPDLNLSKKEILSKIIRYPIVEAIRYVADEN
jgi:hypothetical protein